MKGITTIAAMPSGAGCAAALPAEVGEAKPVLMGVDMATGPDSTVIVNVVTTAFEKTAIAGEIDRMLKQPSGLRQWQERCRANITER